MQEHPPQDSGGYWRRLKKKEDSKGFTLVELIVVIVILAILAAILIPGLLKWIDQAKDKKYELEAREIAMAAEAALTTMYGQGKQVLVEGGKLKMGSSTDLMQDGSFSVELGKFTDAAVEKIEIYGNSDGGTPKKWAGSATGFEITFTPSGETGSITASLLPGTNRWDINGSSGGSGGGSDEGPSESTENENPDSDVPVITYDSVTKTVTISGKGDITGDSITELAQYKEAETVVIRYGITGIGAGAFVPYVNLTSITIPSTVTSIGEAAFVGCSSLENITIPSGVTSIGEAAFASCSSLESITIPSSVKSIGPAAFNFCDSLTTIHFGGTQAEWDALNNDIGLTDSATVICNGN